MTKSRLRSDLIFTMPFSNMLHMSFADRVKTTQLAGFSGMTIQPVEVKRFVAEGTSIAEMRKIANDAGIAFGRLDPLCTWVPNWHFTNFPESYVRESATSPDEFFGMCEQLGTSYASLNATFPADRYSTEQITEYYAAICRKGAEHGVTVDMECIPMWGVVSLEQGWDIVRKAGAKNGGLIFDCTHFTRSHSTFATLASIPGDQIHCVQVCDGYIPMRPGVTLEQECFERLWPGKGDFPIAKMLTTLNETGGLRQIGPEVFSASLVGKSPQEIADLCVASLVQYDALAG